MCGGIEDVEKNAAKLATADHGASSTSAVVAVDRKIWSGTATMVVAKTLEGEIGILPRHEPVLALLADSPVRIDDDRRAA